MSYYLERMMRYYYSILLALVIPLHVFGVPDYDCVVVGAGISGAAAAQALQSKGLRVLVVEARNRIGGRLYTEETTLSNGEDFQVDLGASWIHGASRSNPLVALVKNSGRTVSTTDYDNDDTYYSDGQSVPNAELRKYEDTWDEFTSFLAKEQYQYDQDPGLQTVVDSFIRRKKLTGLDLRAFRYNLNVNIVGEYAAPISNLSLWFDEDEGFDGDDVLVLGGYQGVAEYLARDVDVVLQTRVTGIDYSSSDYVTVNAKESGDGSLKSYTAKTVIVTLPLGVLKENSVRFTPALPKVNRDAINALGFGLLNKCVLIFTRAFWGSDIEFIERIDKRGKSGFEETLSLMPAADAPVLYGFNAATYAYTLEKKSDEETCKEMMAALERIWENAPGYVECFVSRWASDPYSKGSYSYTTPLMEYKKAHKDVGRAVGNGMVQFAGEHTSLKNPATVHGALGSGYDASCRVLRKLGKQC